MFTTFVCFYFLVPSGFALKCQKHIGDRCYSINVLLRNVVSTRLLQKKIFTKSLQNLINSSKVFNDFSCNCVSYYVPQVERLYFELVKRFQSSNGMRYIPERVVRRLTVPFLQRKMRTTILLCLYFVLLRLKPGLSSEET